MTTPFSAYISVGSWSTTIDLGDDPTGAPVVVLDDLSAEWKSGEPWPSQPEPVVTSFSLYVPDVFDRPDVTQGTTVHYYIGPSAGASNGPLINFYGRITDVEATPLRDGMRFDITAADYLADLGEETIGDAPWAADYWWNRYLAIANASGLAFDLAPRIPSGGSNLDYGGIGGTAYPVRVYRRDVDAQSTADVLEELLRQVAAWQQQGLDVSNPNASGLNSRGPWQRWNRPVVAYKNTADGPLFTLDYVSQGTYPDNGGLPYFLSTDPGTGQVALSLRPAAPSAAAWVPASAAVRAVAWRQDKANHPNRVRVTLTEDPDKGTTEAPVERVLDDQVAARGPVEVAYDQSTPAAYGYASALMYLGDEYDATPRFAFDEVTVLPERIADPEFWPRLFPDPTFGTTAAGRFVLVTGIPAKWNLYRLPDFPGRLTGATLKLRKGRVEVTARLHHQIPTVNGEAGQMSAQQLAAQADLGDPTAAEFGDLTAVDLRLVGTP